MERVRWMSSGEQVGLGVVGVSGDVAEDDEEDDG